MSEFISTVLEFNKTNKLKVGHFLNSILWCVCVFKILAAGTVVLMCTPHVWAGQYQTFNT